jgi:hypothetical protein
MEADGITTVVLFMALNTSFSVLLFLLFASTGVFSMYLGKGVK